MPFHPSQPATWSAVPPPSSPYANSHSRNSPPGPYSLVLGLTARSGGQKLATGDNSSQGAIRTQGGQRACSIPVGRLPSPATLAVRDRGHPSLAFPLEEQVSDSVLQSNPDASREKVPFAGPLHAPDLLGDRGGVRAPHIRPAGTGSRGHHPRHAANRRPRKLPAHGNPELAHRRERRPPHQFSLDARIGRLDRESPCGLGDRAGLAGALGALRPGVDERPGLGTDRRAESGDDPHERRAVDGRNQRHRQGARGSGCRHCDRGRCRAIPGETEERVRPALGTSGNRAAGLRAARHPAFRGGSPAILVAASPAFPEFRPRHRSRAHGGATSAIRGGRPSSGDRARVLRRGGCRRCPAGGPGNRRDRLSEHHLLRRLRSPEGGAAARAHSRERALRPDHTNARQGDSGRARGRSGEFAERVAGRSVLQPRRRTPGVRQSGRSRDARRAPGRLSRTPPAPRTTQPTSPS